MSVHDVRGITIILERVNQKAERNLPSLMEKKPNRKRPTSGSRSYVSIVLRLLQLLIFVAMPLALFVGKHFAPNTRYYAEGIREHPTVVKARAQYEWRLIEARNRQSSLLLGPRFPYVFPEPSVPLSSWAQRSALAEYSNAISLFAFNCSPLDASFGTYVFRQPLRQPDPGSSLLLLGKLEGPSRIRMGESHELKLSIWLTNGARSSGATEVTRDRDYLAVASLQAPAFDLDADRPAISAKPLETNQPTQWAWVITPKEKHLGEQILLADVALREARVTNYYSYAWIPYALSGPGPTLPFLRCGITISDPIPLPGWAVNFIIPLAGAILFFLSQRLLTTKRIRTPSLPNPPAPRSVTASPLPIAVPLTQRIFLVALSFPGEQRPFVAAVADRLSAALGKDNVFFDNYYEAELAQPDLDLLLGDIYGKQSKLVVPFYSADYARKKWCNLEWRRMREILFNLEAERIMPFRFDDTPIEGVLSFDGYIKVGTRTPEEVAKLILERLQTLPPDTAPEQPPPS